MRHSFNPCLYLVIGPENCHAHSMEDIVREAIDGGVSLVQYRNKSTNLDDQIKDVRSLLEITKTHHIPLLVNDNVDVALATKADGVHLGQSDIDAKVAREKLGDNAIIGLTVKNMNHVKAAPLEVLDYLGVGGIFPTSSKNNPDAPIGLDGLREMVTSIAAHSGILTTAIAGLNEDNCEEVVKCGVNGIAIISSICNSASPKHTAQSIRSKIDRAMKVREQS